MYYMGIDGGGTKTRYVIANQEMDVLVDFESETIHIHQIGADELRNRLESHIKLACSKIDIQPTDLNFVFIGVPGYGESQADKEVIDDILAEVMQEIPYQVDNDGVVGWAAGCGCQPGINIVAGTGSIANGRNKEGLSLRCGGFGPNIGDDGSAHWIGLRVINEYTKQKDGRHEKTCLVDIIEEAYDITYLYEIVDIVFNRLKLSRPDIAKFSAIGAKAAQSGCIACQNLFHQAAHELALHIKTLAKQLNLTDSFAVSYSGGVFKSGDTILVPLANELQNLDCKIQAPLLEPCLGAVLLAYQLEGNNVTDELIQNYKHTKEVEKSPSLLTFKEIFFLLLKLFIRILTPFSSLTPRINPYERVSPTLKIPSFHLMQVSYGNIYDTRPLEESSLKSKIIPQLLGNSIKVFK